MAMLPVEEGRLNNPALRENFIRRVFRYRRWQTLMQRGWSLDAPGHFHVDHKMLLMAQSPAHHARLGRLVAAAARGRQRRGYDLGFMEALSP